MLVFGTDTVILALFWCSAIRLINRVCGHYDPYGDWCEEKASETSNDTAAEERE